MKAKYKIDKISNGLVLSSNGLVQSSNGHNSKTNEHISKSNEPDQNPNGHITTLIKSLPAQNTHNHQPNSNNHHPITTC